MESIFPKDMMKKTEFTLESIASKLLYFQEGVHLFHWQTTSYAEHKALGSMYEYIQSFRDDVMEKLMGYMSKRVGNYKIEQCSCPNINILLEDICMFSCSLGEWASKNKYSDIENMAQELSGQAAKTKYLLTLK